MLRNLLTDGNHVLSTECVFLLQALVFLYVEQRHSDFILRGKKLKAERDILGYLLHTAHMILFSGFSRNNMVLETLTLLLLFSS